MRHVTRYAPTETRQFPGDICQFSNCACCEQCFLDNEHNRLHLARKHAQIFFLDIIWSSKLTVFLELRSRKTVRFQEQIGTDLVCNKYLPIFSRQIEAILFIYMQSRLVISLRHVSYLYVFCNLP